MQSRYHSCRARVGGEEVAVCTCTLVQLLGLPSYWLPSFLLMSFILLLANVQYSHCHNIPLCHVVPLQDDCILLWVD